MSFLDNYVSPGVRRRIEERYYARISEKAKLENLIHDPTFSNLDGRHVALFSDHGVIHVRDIALQVLETLEKMHGLLLPLRSSNRLAWMREYGILLVLLHDIGMVDFSTFGRIMHPEIAAQAAFSAELDDVIDLIWLEKSGKLVERLLTLDEQGVFVIMPEVILRELLAMSMGHSKRKVSIEVLNDPLRLRDVMIEATSTDLQLLYQRQQLTNKPTDEYGSSENSEKTPDSGLDQTEHEDNIQTLPADTHSDSQTNSGLLGHYDDVEQLAFQWMIATNPAAVELFEDVIDTIRIVRCADALRQRGTVLKTSGSYEVFVDQRTANAVYALRKGEDQLILLEMPDAISAGEANIASSQLDQDGNVRISFHRGSFANPGAVNHAAYSAALVLIDIKEDVIDSFERAADVGLSDLKPAAEMKILLEDTDDNPDFIGQIRQQLERLSPDTFQRIELVPSLQKATEFEREFYLDAEPLDWDVAKRCEVLAEIERTGLLVSKIDPNRAFRDVRRVTLSEGQNLVEAGDPSAFIYIPMGQGLKIVPLGGYQSFMAKPWAPLGITGVIRGATRNATIMASCDVELLMMPKSVYLRHWYHTYSPDAFKTWLQEAAAEKLADEGSETAIGRTSG